MLLALGAWGLNHQITREAPRCHHFWLQPSPSFLKMLGCLGPQRGLRGTVPFQSDFLVSHHWHVKVLLHFMYSEHITEKIGDEILYLS